MRSLALTMQEVPLSSPGAGPSRLASPNGTSAKLPRGSISHDQQHRDSAEDEEEADRALCELSSRPMITLMLVAERRRDYVELERSVESSNALLDSLASYLSTFQHDLSAVSGQVADLQSRSAEIEAQLKGRKVS